MTTEYGNKNVNDVSKFMALRPGVSTKIDVYNTFGQPHDVAYLSPQGDCRWRYFTVQMRSNGLEFVPLLGLAAAGQNTDTKITDFSFDSKNCLRDVVTKSKAQFVQNFYGLTEDIIRSSTDPKKMRVQQEMAKIGEPYDPKIASAVVTE